MNTFQIVGLSLVASFSMGAAFRLTRGRQRLSSAGWLCLWLAAGVALYEPNLTRDVAQVVGIRRGADLISYLTTLSLLAVVFFMSIRLRRFEAYITQLTRELALTRAPVPVRIDPRPRMRSPR